MLFVNLFESDRIPDSLDVSPNFENNRIIELDSQDFV